MNDIFVSYSSEDRERVQALVRAIEAQGCDVFWDREITYGESYRRVIDEALKQAKCAIVVWSRSSVDSEWVTNEASEARKSGILVPVLIDDVQPPLEFRHLQAAELFRWQGSDDDPELKQLMAAVRSVLQRSADGAASPSSGHGRAPLAAGPPPRPGKSWWQTPAGWAVGAAALLIAAAVFLMTVKQLLGGRQAEAPTAAMGNAPAGEPESRSSINPGASSPPATTRPASSGESFNLLDVSQGAQIVAANESGWKDYIFNAGRREPYCSVLSSQGFATFAFRDERRARFDRLGVFVEATNSYNFKTVELHASDQSDQGPFRKVATIAVPNYRNERQKLHQFRFDPVTARYVKLVVVDFQHGSGAPNGNVCTMELYGSLL